MSENIIGLLLTPSLDIKLGLLKLRPKDIWFSVKLTQVQFNSRSFKFTSYSYSGYTHIRKTELLKSDWFPKSAIGIIGSLKVRTISPKDDIEVIVALRVGETSGNFPRDDVTSILTL